MGGQPIMVDCLLTNPAGTPGIDINSEDTLEIYSTNTPGCQVWFELYDAKNHPVFREARPDVKYPSCCMPPALTGDTRLKSAFVVSRTAMPQAPGKYTLHAHVMLQYISNSFSEREAPDATCQHNIFSKEVELPLVVAPADTTPLRKIASKLSTVIKEGSAASAVAIRAMVSMPETIAYPYWCELANTRQLKMSAFLVRDLQLLGSMYAARALAAMWGDEFKEDRNLEAKTALIELHQTAAPAVRRYIGNVYRDRESKELIDSEHPIIRALDAD